MCTQKVRKFRESDLASIETNEFSCFDGMGSVFNIDGSVKVTVEDGDEIICILVAIEYSESKWKGFLLASTKMGATHGGIVKEVVKEFFTTHNVSRLETESVDCEKLNRWHEFLGFELEGKKRRFIGDKDFNVWSILKWE